MRSKIAILGSTGSIGKNLLKIVSENFENYEIVLLTANSNYKALFQQAKKFKVKNLIITNNEKYKLLEDKVKNLNINLYNNFNFLDLIFKNKVDYIMSSIVGIDGLKPTISCIKYTRKIAIANKESIICGWGIIKKELKKNKTKFVPVDSEHFSIWFGVQKNENLIDNLIITASGGPFLKLPLSHFRKITTVDALKHPNWKMGKKISIDSSTMMNKVFEVIEAKNLFNVTYKDISILTHPTSYIHAIIKFKNGLIKIIAHDTDMKIPIYNSIIEARDNKIIKTDKINVKKLNELNLKTIDTKKFPTVNILNQLPKKNSLFETILVSANDELVNSFLAGKIAYSDISIKLMRFINKKEFQKYKKKEPKNVKEILKLNNYVRFKIQSESI